MSKVDGNTMRGDRGLISQTSCLSRLWRRGRKRSGWGAEVGADSRDCRNDGSVVAGRSSHMSLADQCQDALGYEVDGVGVSRTDLSLDNEPKEACWGSWDSNPRPPSPAGYLFM